MRKDGKLLSNRILNDARSLVVQELARDDPNYYLFLCSCKNLVDKVSRLTDTGSMKEPNKQVRTNIDLTQRALRLVERDIDIYQSRLESLLIRRRELKLTLRDAGLVQKSNHENA